MVTRRKPTKPRAPTSLYWDAYTPTNPNTSRMVATNSTVPLNGRWRPTTKRRTQLMGNSTPPKIVASPLQRNRFDDDMFSSLHSLLDICQWDVMFI
jgi:hypothetical protein